MAKFFIESTKLIIETKILIKKKEIMIKTFIISINKQKPRMFAKLLYL